MSDVPKSERNYSDDEFHALRSAGMTMSRGRGAAYYACGDYWPRELRRRADHAARSIEKLRLAAAAFEREAAAWPGTMTDNGQPTGSAVSS